MTIACKLWLLAVVCIAFLYQDSSQGNGVLCVKIAKQLDDNLSGNVSSEENNDDSDSQSNDSSGGGDSDGSGVGNNSEGSNEGDDDDDDDDVHEKKSKKSKNHHDNDDDDHHHHHLLEEDKKDREDEDAAASFDDDDEKNKELHENIKHKINNNNRTGKMQISMTTTIITGKPKDVLKYLNAEIKPYEPVALEKSNSKLLQKIKSVTKKSKSSKGKKGSNEDLTNYLSHILKQSSKNKNNKQVDSDKILMTLLKSALLHILKDI